MFGLGRSKVELTPLPVWDDWNECFEYENGNTISKTLMGKMEFYSNDLQKEITVEGFFAHLLAQAWEEGDDFNPKKPFGEKNWKDDLIKCFIHNKLVKGVIAPIDELREYDRHVFNFLITHYLKVPNNE
jgi:hypothetical protein